MKMKTTSGKLNEIWEELQDIFLNLKRFDNRTINRLYNIGFEVVQIKGNHPKMYFTVNGKKCVITLSVSPSDIYANRQTLRRIRKAYEEGEQ